MIKLNENQKQFIDGIVKGMGIENNYDVVIDLPLPYILIQLEDSNRKISTGITLEKLPK